MDSHPLVVSPLIFLARVSAKIQFRLALAANRSLFRLSSFSDCLCRLLFRRLINVPHFFALRLQVGARRIDLQQIIEVSRRCCCTLHQLSGFNHFDSRTLRVIHYMAIVRAFWAMFGVWEPDLSLGN